MRAIAFTAFAGLFLVTLQSASFAQGMMPDAVKVSGGMLTDSKGMTLYTFDNDKEPGKSACSGGCIKNWPALAASSGAMAMGDWSQIARDDGSMQWAYKGKPLYTYSKDAKPGDMTGDGRGQVWHMAMP